MESVDDAYRNALPAPLNKRRSLMSWLTKAQPKNLIVKTVQGHGVYLWTEEREDAKPLMGNTVQRVGIMAAGAGSDIVGMDMTKFLHLVHYVLTNVAIQGDHDPRLTFVQRIRESRVAKDPNCGHTRLEISMKGL